MVRHYHKCEWVFMWSMLFLPNFGQNQCQQTWSRSQIQNFTIVHLVGVMLLYVDRLIVTFCNCFVKVTKYCIWMALCSISQCFCKLSCENSKELSLSWDDGISTSSQEIPCTLWNPKIHYCGHKSTSLVTILSQINSIHTIPSYFFKIHFNIILPSLTRYSKWPLCFRFPHKYLVSISLLP
jgi:hypothetical protein